MNNRNQTRWMCLALALLITAFATLACAGDGGRGVIGNGITGGGTTVNQTQFQNTVGDLTANSPAH